MKLFMFIRIFLAQSMHVCAIFAFRCAMDQTPYELLYKATPSLSLTPLIPVSPQVYFSSRPHQY